MSRAENQRTPPAREVSDSRVGRIREAHELIEHTSLRRDTLPELIDGATETPLLNLGESRGEPSIP